MLAQGQQGQFSQDLESLLKFCLKTAPFEPTGAPMEWHYLAVAQLIAFCETPLEMEQAAPLEAPSLRLNQNSS